MEHMWLPQMSSIGHSQNYSAGIEGIDIFSSLLERWLLTAKRQGMTHRSISLFHNNNGLQSDAEHIVLIESWLCWRNEKDEEAQCIISLFLSYKFHIKISLILWVAHRQKRTCPHRVAHDCYCNPFWWLQDLWASTKRSKHTWDIGDKVSSHFEKECTSNKTDI